MKDESTDQLVVLAQMMADSDSHGARAVINRNLSLIVIMLVGMIATLLSVVAAIQWERHVDYTVSKIAETIYFNQIDSSLGLMQHNTEIMTAFVMSSEYVSKEEFAIFSSPLVSLESSADFVYMSGYSNHHGLDYLGVENKYIKDEISSILSAPKTREYLQSLNTGAKDNYFTLRGSARDGGYVVHFRSLDHPDFPDGIFMLSGVNVQNLILNPEYIPQNIEVKVSDSSGTAVVYRDFLDDDYENLYQIEHPFESLNIELAVDLSLLPVRHIENFKWVLISFSFIFTFLIGIQYIYAKRSIRKLAKFAVQRTSELTAINSELTDEIISRIDFQAKLMQKNIEIQDANKKLDEVQDQLIQQEKLASLGQLAAGVAHEINNPVGFINSNLTMMKKYSERSLQLISILNEISESTPDEKQRSWIEEKKKEYKYESLLKNMIDVVEESQEGVERVKQIVQDLKDFSRIDEAEWQRVDLHTGIESTLNIAWNEIKYKAEVHKEYSELPLVECVPSQINQIILNLLVNSAHAMKTTGNIYLRTRQHGDSVVIEVEDDGCGIPDTIINKIFDPFFTTKEVGKGTGLGLSLSYGIVQKHNGTLSVKSEPDVGTTFTITLPIKRAFQEGEVSGDV
ncbi:MAG: hypothetical protein D6160_14365 [Ketobacter sp.]|nr:MAG: hypothetical protein D6160_14365 [Ketobacter sp.]